jgi:hypothetical protein
VKKKSRLKEKRECKGAYPGEKRKCKRDPGLIINLPAMAHPDDQDDEPGPVFL